MDEKMLPHLPGEFCADALLGLVAAGKLTPSEAEEAVDAVKAASDEVGPGAPTEARIQGAARYMNMRWNLVPLFVVIDDYAGHQRTFFANVHEISAYMKQCPAEWNVRVAGLAWVAPDKVRTYLDQRSHPWRPCPVAGPGGETCAANRLGHPGLHGWEGADVS